MIVDAVHYDGSFDIDFLLPGESVKSAGDGTHAVRVVWTRQVGGITVGGSVRVPLGSWVVRTVDGPLVACGWDQVARLHAEVGA